MLRIIIKKEENQNVVLHALDLQVSPLSYIRRRVTKPYNTKIWDPGIDHDPDKRNKLLKINVSYFIYSFIATVMLVKVDDGVDTDIKE